MDQTLSRLQHGSPFEAALHRSPFETATVQAHVAEELSESSSGKEQLRLLSKDGAGKKTKHRFPPPRQGQRTAPSSSPFDKVPPGLPSLSTPRRPSTDPENRCFDWQLVKQMGSSMEDILSIVSRMSSASLGRIEGLSSVVSNGSGSDPRSSSESISPSVPPSIGA